MKRGVALGTIGTLVLGSCSGLYQGRRVVVTDDEVVPRAEDTERQEELETPEETRFIPMSTIVPRLGFVEHVGDRSCAWGQSSGVRNSALAQTSAQLRALSTLSKYRGFSSSQQETRTSTSWSRRTRLSSSAGFVGAERTDYRTIGDSTYVQVCVPKIER